MSHTDTTQSTRQIARSDGDQGRQPAGGGRWRGVGRLRAIELALLGAVLVLGPFFRGLFFDEQVFYFTFIIGLLLASTARLRRKTDLMELALFGLACCYVLGIPWAVNKGDAVLGCVRMLSYAALYCAAGRILTPPMVKVGAWLLALTMSAVVLAGIGSGVGVPPIEGGWKSGLCSFLQYHNALGGYLLMGVPVTAWLYRESKLWWQKQLAAGALYFEFLGLVGSQSRGSWLCLFLVLLLIAAAFRRERSSMVALLLILWTALDDWAQIAAAKEANHWSVLLWPFVGLAVVWLIEWVRSGLQAKKNAQAAQTVVFLFVLIVLAAGVVPVIHPPSESDLSTFGQARSLSLADTSWQERVKIYKDALRLGLSRPLTGFGAGGWVAAFRAHQNAFYSAKSTHSEPLQILVEAGLPGLCFYGLFWLAFFARWVRSWKESHLQADYLIGAAAVGIFLHSLVDFDLSESAIFFTLILVLAAGRTVSSSGNREVSQDQRLGGWAATNFSAALAGMLLLFSPPLAVGVNYAKAGAEAVKAGHAEKAVSHYQSALKFLPLQAAARAELARLETDQGLASGEARLLVQGIKDLDTAINYSPMDPTLRAGAARICASAGRRERAYREAQETVRLAGLYRSCYEAVAHYGLPYAQELLQQGNVAEGRVILNQIVALPQSIDRRLASLPEAEQAKARREQRLVVTPGLRQLLEQSQALLSREQTD